jgi:putative membrane protein
VRNEGLLAPEARKQAIDAVGEIEAVTSAEVVVTVRRQSASYRASDLLAGSALAFAALLCLLFLPQPFAVTTMPLDVLVSFGLGALVSARSPLLRRLLAPARTRQRNVHAASRAAFVDLGVSRTRGRGGLLVYVSLLEQAVEIVADIGIDPGALGPAWSDAVGGLEAAVRRGDVAAFRASLVRLAAPLAQALPRQADDVDELPNDLGGA